MDLDLDQAMKRALREMIGFICGHSNLPREEAYQLCSLAVDFRVSQTVNGEQASMGCCGADCYSNKPPAVGTRRALA